MSEILLCNRPFDSQQLSAQCGIDIDQLMGCGCARPTSINPNTPYLLNPEITDPAILNLLSPQPIARNLTDLSLSLGGDNLLALSQISEKLRDPGVGLLAESAGLARKSGAGLTGAIHEYQAALLAYREAIVNNPARKASARQSAQAAFDKLQNLFRTEMRLITMQTRARRGTALTSFDRAASIATSSRSAAKLHVADSIEAQRLVRFTRYATTLNNGLTVIDFGSRVDNIQTTYKAGGNWHREMFAESLSFVAGTAAATAVAETAFALCMIATPVGWVGIVISVLAVGGAAGASMWASESVRDGAGGWYDSIMKRIAR